MAKKYRAKYSGRVYDTKEEAIRDNVEYKNNVAYRYSIKGQQYKSPLINYDIPFISDKAITLTNAGLATGAILSTNVLDSIADNAELAGLPLKTAIGLAVKESTLNNQTSSIKDRAKISRADSDALKTAAINNYAPIPVIQSRGTKNVLESELINFNPDDNPYISTMMYLNPPPRSGRRVRISQEEFNKKLEKSELFDDKRAEYRQKQQSKSYLQAGFEFYKNNPDKYNPGQKNYQELVNKRGEEVWDSPEVQSWYRRRLESRGNKSK